MATARHAMSIQHWARTQEGLELIESQRPFIVGSSLWQGYNKVAIKIHEDQLTDQELEGAEDVDGTKVRIWEQRRERLRGRLDRKQAEYQKRRGELRVLRNTIRDSIVRDKELGLPASADDLEEIKRIDGRLARLRDLDRERSLEVADQATAPKPQVEEQLADMPAAETEEAPALVFACPTCGKRGKNAKWLRMHRLGAHRER